MLSEKDIKERIINGSIIIAPLSEDNIEDSGIVVKASEIAWLIPQNKEEKSKVLKKEEETIDKSSHYFVIPPERTAIVVAIEDIYLNHEVAGIVSQIMDLRMKGLLYAPSPVKSNSANKFLICLTNTTNKQIHLKVGEKIAIIQLHKLDTSEDVSNDIKANSNIKFLQEINGIPEEINPIKQLYCEVYDMRNKIRESDFYKELERQEKEKKEELEREELKVFFIRVANICMAIAVLFLLFDSFSFSIEEIKETIIKTVVLLTCMLGTLAMIIMQFIAIIQACKKLSNIIKKWNIFSNNRVGGNSSE